MNATTHRIRCAHCKDAHSSIADIQACKDSEDYYAAEARHEFEAERRAERYFEEGTEAQHAAYLGELEMEARHLGL